MIKTNFDSDGFQRDMMQQAKLHIEDRIRKAILKIEPNCPDLKVEMDMVSQKINITGVSEEVASQALDSTL